MKIPPGSRRDSPRKKSRHATPSKQPRRPARLSFPYPYLNPFTKNLAPSPTPEQPRQRKTSYERRHGGPQFTIYEDETATNDVTGPRVVHGVLPYYLVSNVAYEELNLRDKGQENYDPGNRRDRDTDTDALTGREREGRVRRPLVAIKQYACVVLPAAARQPPISKERLRTLGLMR